MCASEFSVIDQFPDDDGLAVVYGEGLTHQEALALAAEVEAEDDGRVPLVYDHLP